MMPSQQIDSNLVTRILSEVHIKQSAALSDFPQLDKLINHTWTKLEAILTILEGQAAGQLNGKLMHAACLLAGEETTAGILSRMVFYALNVEELSNLAAFALTLLPYYPDAMKRAVECLVPNAEMYAEELMGSKLEYTPLASSTPGNHRKEERVPTRFIHNLLMLFQWQDTSTLADHIHYLGICVAELNGGLQMNLLEWGLSYVKKLEQTHNGVNTRSALVVDAFLMLIDKLIPQTPLRLRFREKLLSHFSAIIVVFLKIVNKERFGKKVDTLALDGVDFVFRFSEIVAKFFENQPGASKDMLLNALLNEVLESSVVLFGTKRNLSGTSGEVRSELFDSVRSIAIANDPKNVSADWKTIVASNETEYSLLTELRKTPLGGGRTATQMVHSGELRKRPPTVQSLLKASEGEETTALRSFLFVYFMYQCTSGDKTACKFLAETLSERLCASGITLSFSWGDWEVEKTLVPRYLEIVKLMEDLPYVYNLLLQVTEVGFLAICYMLPLLKAQLATVLIDLESTPMKEGPVRDLNINRLSKLFTLFIASGFLSQTLSTVYDIIRRTSNFDAYVILLEFWKLVQLIIPPTKDKIEEAEEYVKQHGPFLLKKEFPGGRLGEMLVLTVQRNINTLGRFLPEIEASVGERPEDEWR